MSQKESWQVSQLVDGRTRAFYRGPKGDSFSVTRSAAGGAFVVVRFKCPADIFESMVKAGGDLVDVDVKGLEILDAVEVPSGLIEALVGLS